MPMTFLKLRTSQLEEGSYLIHLPHKDYANQSLFDHLNKFIKHNNPPVKSLTMTEEGYFVVTTKEEAIVEVLAREVGWVLFNLILTKTI